MTTHRCDHPASYCRLCDKGLPRDPTPPPKPRGRCPHLGDDTGGRQGCAGCKGKVELKVLACAIHGTCTVGKPAPNAAACCATCTDHPEAE